MTAPATPLEIVSFPVEGMTCASCVNRITRFLGKVDGVEEANVNLATESATVRFDAGHACRSADLVAAVDAAGYVARVGAGGDGRPRGRRRRGGRGRRRSATRRRAAPRRTSGAGSWSRPC